jgi:hypothetical protein
MALIPAQSDAQACGMMATLSSNYTVAAEPHLSSELAGPALDSSRQIYIYQLLGASNRAQLRMAGALLRSLRLSQATS